MILSLMATLGGLAKGLNCGDSNTLLLGLAYTCEDGVPKILLPSAVVLSGVFPNGLLCPNTDVLCPNGDAPPNAGAEKPALDDFDSVEADSPEVVSPNLKELCAVSYVDSLLGAPKLTSLFGAPKITSLLGAPKVTSLFGAPKVTSLFRAPKVTALFGAPKVT